MWKEAYMPKTSSIHSAVSIEHQLVIDTDTDRHGHRPIAIPRMHSIAR